jgi:hypothetical protein
MRSEGTRWDRIAGNAFEALGVVVHSIDNDIVTRQCVVCHVHTPHAIISYQMMQCMTHNDFIHVCVHYMV